MKDYDVSCVRSNSTGLHLGGGGGGVLVILLSRYGSRDVYSFQERPILIPEASKGNLPGHSKGEI